MLVLSDVNFSDQRNGVRKQCAPWDIDIYSLNNMATFYSLKVINESKYGIGCVGSSEVLPEVGEELDWRGLKRYSVCWVAEKDNESHIGLKAT